MLRADILLARFIATTINRFLAEAGVPASAISAIGSHGQTIRHLPDGDSPNTLQIGDPNTIAQLTGITTVADFRRRDMAAGGQGAPLVPAFHQALFRSPEEDRVVVNIGGIGNITVLPARATLPVIGFDTGPGNVLMDAWFRAHHKGDYDRGGQWASSGRVDSGLLHTLLEEAYFFRTPPKSTGRELFNLGWLQRQLGGTPLRPEDVQATLCQLTADSVMQAIARHGGKPRRILVCGGGVHNQALIQAMQAQLEGGVVLESTAAHGIDPDCVEGACFAWLASQALRGEPANLPAVTGAEGPVVLGGVYPA